MLQVKLVKKGQKVKKDPWQYSKPIALMQPRLLIYSAMSDSVASFATVHEIFPCTLQPHNINRADFLSHDICIHAMSIAFVCMVLKSIIWSTQSSLNFERLNVPYRHPC